MGTFSGQISRELAVQHGRGALMVGASGSYCTTSGIRVDIKTPVEMAVKGTLSYPPDTAVTEIATGEYNTVIGVRNETTLSAGKRLLNAGYHPVALNFASATSPGGGFLEGSRAQEEYLARSTCLYECLRENPMYAFHRAAYDPLYTNYVIYSPNVPVIRGDEGDLLEKSYDISIITSPAVNARKLPQDRCHETGPAMWHRILKVLSVGVVNGHDAIVLGAWGCGAFGNDAHEIADLFHKALSENFRGAYRKVVFAITDWSADHKFIGPFEEVFTCDTNDGREASL